jgi:hypothetical protein
MTSYPSYHQCHKKMKGGVLVKATEQRSDPDRKINIYKYWQIDINGDFVQSMRLQENISVKVDDKSYESLKIAFESKIAHEVEQHSLLTNIDEHLMWCDNWKALKILYKKIIAYQILHLSVKVNYPGQSIRELESFTL